MLLVRRNNDFDWLNNWFDDNFFNTPVMAQTTTTAPAVNVKEDNKQYVMEVAVSRPEEGASQHEYRQRRLSYPLYREQE